jgi:hypothetical protein
MTPLSRLRKPWEAGANGIIIEFTLWMPAKVNPDNNQSTHVSDTAIDCAHTANL